MFGSPTRTRTYVLRTIGFPAAAQVDSCSVPESAGRLLDATAGHKKGLQSGGLFDVWLPDPDSNQGPID